ncbi:MAG: LCP family protein [Firmicutes bacterium]|nr:LCP family protein [Bacillota bacterium]
MDKTKKPVKHKAKSADARTSNIPTLIIMTVTIILSVIFCLFLRQLNLLTDRYFAIVCIALIIVILILFLLVRDFSLRLRPIIGLLFSIAFCAVLIYGSRLLYVTHNAIGNITTAATEVTEMHVYVRSDDAANDLSDTIRYTYGIMGEQNRDVTDKAIRHLTEDLGTTLSITEFDSPVTLVNALLNKDVDAILFNASYLTLLGELENFHDINTRVKQLTSLTVETEKPVPVDNSASTESSKEESASKKDRVITIFITGIDTYGEVSITSRSDVNIIATINLDTHQIALVTTPRDYYVEFSNAYGNYDKLTHAGIYGVDTSIETLELLYDIDIDYYFRVNFSGFQDIIDAIGGITVDNDVSFSTTSWIAEQYYFPAGEIYLDGQNALVYVRERSAFGDGDMARGRHQMLVIQAVIDKCTSTQVLSNYTSLLEAIEGNFETSIPYDLISEIVKEQLESGASWNVVSYSVSGYNDWRTCWSLGTGASVVTPYYETVDAAKELMRQVRDGEVPVAPED